jgi:hypothetical protein
MKDADYPLAIRYRKFTFALTTWVGGVHPLPFWLLLLGTVNPLYGLGAMQTIYGPLFGLTPPEPGLYVDPVPTLWIITAIAFVCVVAGMYSVARMRGLPHSAAVGFLHGTRYLNGDPVIFPRRIVR